MVAIIPAESANKTISEKNISFRWIYILLPVAVLLLSVILAAYFYRLLPAEVAYHFEDGLPDRWMSRGAFLALMIALQLVLALLGLIIVSVATITGRRLQLEENAVIRRLLAIMGNIAALPQVILTFAMLDIFLYNAYQIHLIPVWSFALMVMVLGGIILCIFFIQAIRQARGLAGKSLQE